MHPGFPANRECATSMRNANGSQSGRLTVNPTSENSVLDERRLRRLIDAGRGLVAELDPEIVLSRLLEVACEMTDARYAAIGILDSDRHELERFITRGIDEEEKRAIGSLPRGRGVLGLLIGEPKPLRLSDVGEHPRSYGFPAGHPPMDSFLGVPILIRGEAWGNLYLTEKVGADFDQRDEQVAIVLAEWTAIAVDNARLFKNAEEQRDALAQAVLGLEATTEIARALGGETDVDRILETVAKRGRALADARSLLILLEDHGELRIAAVAGDSDRAPDQRISPQGSPPWEVFDSRASARVRNLGGSQGSEPAPEESGGPALLVPLIFRGRAVGVIVALDPISGDPEFSAETERVLSSFSVSAATAVATAQSVALDRLRKSVEAAELERGRWARELHDESLQSMAGLRVLLTSARRDGADVDQLLVRAIAQVDSTIDEMRRLIADLRPPALDELGLAAALEALVERLAGDDLLDVVLEMKFSFEEGTTPTRLSAAVEDTIYRLVQEALNNAIRHSGVDRAQVSVHEKGESIAIEITDEGVGFDTAETSTGFGLRGMRERVELVGGVLNFTSVEGSGTVISAELPAERRNEAGA